MRMSNNFLKFVKKAAVGMALLCLSGLSTAATLTVTPSVISNTYTGVITLQISGIPGGDQVQIRKNIDLNANGTVDPGEPIMESFKISDGGAFVESGVTNINVPFDSNSATGAITTALSFAPPRVLENMVGQYIFTLSSPSGHFSPQQAIFTVTNAALSQSVSGIVHSNGVASVPYAVVVVLNYPSSDYAGGVVADGTGHYQLNLNPGAYQIMSVFPGYVADGSLAPQVTLTNGMAATNDLFLTNGTVTISGSVSDTSGNTPAGVMLNLKSGSLMAVAFTDTNGNYSAAVTPAIWKINVQSDSVAQRAYVVSQSNVQVDTTGGSVTGVNLTLYKANALFYGSITDTNGAPFANIEFKAQDEFYQFAASGYSDANGNYCVAVFGGTNVWTCSPDGSAPPLSSYIISSGFLTNMAPGQAVLQNFTVISVGAQISGHLQDNLGNALAGVGIYASASINGYYFNASADTDTNGNYSLATAAGVWNVSVNSVGNDGLFSLYGLVVTNSYVATIPPTNAVVNITAYPPAALSINAESLPDGYVTDEYEFSLGASGGQPPYSFSLAPASDPLPPGLSLSADGFISGTPTNSGTFNFTVRVMDSTYTTADGLFSITVDPLLQVLTTSLTNGAVGVSYSAQLSATGGEFPYTWLLATNSSILPSGLTLSTNGLLSGVPADGFAGTYNLVVQVNDSADHTAVQPLSLVITTTNQPGTGLPLIAPAFNSDGSFQFGFMSAPGITYTIQSSSNLFTWVSVLSFQSPGGSMLIVDPNAADSSQRFYRLKIGP
jgi:hypothetical protein